VTTVTKSVPVKPFDVYEARKDFPILMRQVNNHPLVYLDNAASSQKPVHVLRQIEDYYFQHHANVHRGVHQLSQEATDLFESARRTIARFINSASDKQVIFTRGTTESINLVAYAFGLSQLKEGDEIILSGLEHHSNIVPWQLVCSMKGATIKVIPVLPDGTLDLSWLAAALTNKTRLVSIAHVSNALGTINPVEEIVLLAHQHGVPVMLDGAQAAPHMIINVMSLDVDFYAFSSHKMYGPTGMGILYGKEAWLNVLPPWQGGGEMIDHVSWAGTTYNELPFKYEAGTPDIAGAIGLAAACDYINTYDRASIQLHESNLLNRCTSAMTSLKGLVPVGTASEKASVFSFNIEGAHPFDVGTILDQQGIAVRTGHHCCQPLMDQMSIPGTVRASFGMYNTAEEVDALVEATSRAIKILS
jgi:cysteine desulfurase/selenocysteine lyase